MISNKHTYAVALTFTGEMEIFLSKLRAPFRAHLHHTFIPHITLVYPFAPAGGIDKVISRLESVAAKARPFTVTLEGIEYFQTVNNVAYIAIKNKDDVRAFMHEIVLSIKDTVTGYYAGDTYRPEHLIPHMTIGEKIPAHIFPEVKKRFAQIEIRRDLEITHFSLAGESNGVWETLQKFEFKG